MPDLIDRKKLLEQMDKYIRDTFMGLGAPAKIFREGYEMAIDHVEYADAVDAEPVRHGRWIYDRMDVVCSHCKTVFKDEINFIQHDGYGRFVTAKRCPECGAHMDLEED